MDIKLTLAIPTYNRCNYLKELLPSIREQLTDRTAPDVEVLVIDNASEDDTQAYIQSNHIPSIRYIRNETNIGGDKNFIECIKNAKGEYVWLFGDDEIISREAINILIDILRSKPDLVIAQSSNEETRHFTSYKSVLKHFDITDPVFPVHHTLITKNVFSRAKFDIQVAQDMLPTNYAHMYGMMELLAQASSIFILSKNNSAFSVREERAPFAETPVLLEKKLTQLCFKIAEKINYRRLKINAWTYFNCKPLYNLLNSRKIKRLVKKWSSST